MRSIDVVWHGVLQDDGFREVMQRARVLHLQAGDVVFREGDRSLGYVVVRSGRIRVSKMDPEGREILLYRVEEGQGCMLTTLCLMGGRHYPADGVVESDAELYMLPPASFEHHLVRSEGFRRQVLGEVGNRVADLLGLIEDIAFGRMDHRLAKVLIRLGEEQGKVVQTTHYALAVELGTAREVVSRLLKDFERRGWIALGRGRIELLESSALRDLG